MVFQYSTNNTPVTGGAAIYIALTTLVNAGWTVKSSSDGTTYNSSGNQITSGGTGTGGYGNAKAWFRIQAPAIGGKNRELTIQTPNTATSSARIKYSPSAGFTGGSPSATQTPTASDEVLLCGSALGTDSSPTGTAIFTADGSYRFSMMAGDISIGYGFYWFASKKFNPKKSEKS